MKPFQRDFLSLCLELEVLRFGRFELKSGRISPYFFNAGLFDTGRALQRLGYYYAQAIKDSGLEFDVIFGPAYKGIPLAAAIAIAFSDHFDRDIAYCFNRKEAKDHGEGGHLVGAPLNGRVLVVDDVVSAGTSVRESADIINQAGATFAGVAIALDRQERGTGELSATGEIAQEFDVPIINIINLDSLIDDLSAREGFAQDRQNIVVYREQYGV
jgi:orotate phosphoribosyltransferase